MTLLSTFLSLVLSPLVLGVFLTIFRKLYTVSLKMAESIYVVDLVGRENIWEKSLYYAMVFGLILFLWVEHDNLLLCYLVTVTISGLAVASVMDLRLQMVSNFFAIEITAVAIIVILIEGLWGKVEVENLAGILAYVIWQELLMSRLYGRADCHIFSATALVLYALGGNFDYCVCELTVSFVIMCLAQGVLGNISGNLKFNKPVPFIPYISLGFITTAIVIVIN